jgi:hypothetical protein
MKAPYIKSSRALYTYLLAAKIIQTNARATILHDSHVPIPLRAAAPAAAPVIQAGQPVWSQAKIAVNQPQR